jgi:hypothetical protein
MKLLERSGARGLEELLNTSLSKYIDFARAILALAGTDGEKRLDGIIRQAAS